MIWGEWILVAVVASSLVPGLIIFALPEERVHLRTVLNLTGALVKLSLVGLLLWGAYQEGHYPELRFTLVPGLDLALKADPLALLFVSLSSVLWLVTTVYAIGYL